MHFTTFIRIKISLAEAAKAIITHEAVPSRHARAQLHDYSARASVTASNAEKMTPAAIFSAAPSYWRVFLTPLADEPHRQRRSLHRLSIPPLYSSTYFIIYDLYFRLRLLY